ncbi:MAG: hypothetical protein U1E46_02050 [Hyphomicrobiales bacterium]
MRVEVESVHNKGEGIKRTIETEWVLVHLSVEAMIGFVGEPMFGRGRFSWVHFHRALEGSVRAGRYREVFRILKVCSGARRLQIDLSGRRILPLMGSSQRRRRFFDGGVEGGRGRVERDRGLRLARSLFLRLRVGNE